MFDPHATGSNPRYGIREFMENIAAKIIPGVRTNNGINVPASIPGAILPVSFVVYPKAEGGPWTFEGGATSPMMTTELIVAVSPIAQGIERTNRLATLDMADAVLQTLAADTGAALSKLFLKVRCAIIEEAGIAYHAVIAEVTARG